MELMPIKLKRPALADRRRVYLWLSTPGIVDKMMGPPTFPDVAPPTYTEFVADYPDFLWLHDQPEAGRVFLIAAQEQDVGCIVQNDIVTTTGNTRAAEIDIWLAGPEFTGRGFGRQAISELCYLLASEFRIAELFLQPSARNEAACVAYQRAGFHRSPLSTKEAAEYYRTRPDYSDSVFFVRRIDESGCAVPPVSASIQSR